MCNTKSTPPVTGHGRSPSFHAASPAPVRIPFQLRLPTQSTTPIVELRGEVDDWTRGRKLTPQPHGSISHGAVPQGSVLHYTTDLALPPGVYAYKLRVDGHWQLDPDNPRTRTEAGGRNNVLVVGGTPEPILFAPGLPYLVHHPRGGIVLTALLRKGQGQSLRVVWTEGRVDTEAVTPMSLVDEEREHLVFRLHVPTSVHAASFRFLLEDGRSVGSAGAGPHGAIPFRFPEPAAFLPTWWRDGIVYTVLVDRFRPIEDHAGWTSDPGPDRPAGGHLEGITRSLDSLFELGIRILHLTPIHLAASAHRYDVADPMHVDPALGGEPAFRRLIEQAHRRGMRVLLDFSFIHAGRGFAPFEDVRENGRASVFASWFQWRKKGKSRVLKHYGRRRDAPLFDLENVDVQALVLRSATRWASFGVDGFRLDAAAQVPLDLAGRIREVLRERAPQALVLGELVPEHAWRWQSSGALDAATDFTFHRTVTSFIADRSMGAGKAAAQMTRAVERTALPGAGSLRFLSTHDHNRFATLATVRGDRARTALGMLMLAAAPGVPMLVYGEEIGMAAEVAGLRPEGVWEDRQPMPWRWTEEQEGFRALTRSLLDARRAHPALREGDFQIVFAEQRLLVARRRCGADVVDVAVNASDAPVEIDLDDDWLDALDVVVSVGQVRTTGQTVALGANAGLMALRRRRLRKPGVEEPRTRLQRAIRDEAFAAGSPEVPTHPTRIDFSLTERCNLRCRHCINFSPTRTRQGTARTLTHSVLDRLREEFAHASYYGFVHGGESLTAPIFFEVLDAIRAARAGAPTLIHLLSNGMLLTPETVDRLIDGGLSSLSVSLDGASASTNDAMRLGCEIGKVVEHLRGVREARARRGADLRVGISTVLTRANLHELEAIVDIAVDVGVDWWKIEELVPSTEDAKAAWVDVDDASLRKRVQEAIERGRERGLVVVDHLSPPWVWHCKLDRDPSMAAFLEADQYANRSEIHPCRTPWERVCIEPNGEVRIGSFHGPALGNIMAESLMALWNGPVARSERVRSRNERICGGGSVTCLR